MNKPFIYYYYYYDWQWLKIKLNNVQIYQPLQYGNPVVYIDNFVKKCSENDMFWQPSLVLWQPRHTLWQLCHKLMTTLSCNINDKPCHTLYGHIMSITSEYRIVVNCSHPSTGKWVFTSKHWLVRSSTRKHRIVKLFTSECWLVRLFTFEHWLVRLFTFEHWLVRLFQFEHLLVKSFTFEHWLVRSSGKC